MNIEELTKEQERQLAIDLQEIYYCAEIQGLNDDKSQFLASVIQIINESKHIHLSDSQRNPEYAYFFSSAHDLCLAFCNRFKATIDSAEKLAFAINDKFGNTIDIASIVCPFVLSQFGVNNDYLSFYIALGMTVAKIVCDNLAKKEEYRRDTSNINRIEDVCSALKEYLEVAKQESIKPEDNAALEKSLAEISRIVDSK